MRHGRHRRYPDPLSLLVAACIMLVLFGWLVSCVNDALP
jgi:hypothetical protein